MESKIDKKKYVSKIMLPNLFQVSMLISYNDTGAGLSFVTFEVGAKIPGTNMCTNFEIASPCAVQVIIQMLCTGLETDTYVPSSTGWLAFRGRPILGRLRRLGRCWSCTTSAPMCCTAVGCSVERGTHA